MAEKSPPEWVLPAAIPFDQLKRRDLEECVYWLMDAMGAKDLEWRVGGSGDGAADQGRDLEAHFFTPEADGELGSQKWWIECKGRQGTVESDAVKSSVNNSLAIADLEYLVIATNTTFSNPTRDWVKQWQTAHARPKVKLWDRTQLERLLSRHPAVVLRLFSQALSVDGRLRAVETRFWSKLEFSNAATLAEIWKYRDTLQFEPLATFALVANEFANGSIVQRPWPARLDDVEFWNVLVLSFANVPYLMLRGTKAGIDPKPITRGLAYLLIVAIDKLDVGQIVKALAASVSDEQGQPFPSDVRELLLEPVLDQLFSEIQDVCTSDCVRVSTMRKGGLTGDKDEIEGFWLRLDPSGAPPQPENSDRYLRIEKLTAPCNVGFAVDEKNGCPLFALDTKLENIEGVLEVLERVVSFRKAQAGARRKKKPGASA